MRSLLVRLFAVGMLGAFMFLQPSGQATNSVRASNGNDSDGYPGKIISGFADYELNSSNASLGQNSQASNYQPRGSNTCSVNISSNIKINQNCEDLTGNGGGGQANNETSIAEDPLNANNIIASANDYRRGDGSCYTSYSTDGGRTWNDTTVPNDEVSGSAYGGFPVEYYQAAGDTSVAWDTKGNGYLACQMFNRGPGTSPNNDASSSVYVFRSTGNQGASWNFPGHAVVISNDTTGGAAPFIDKPYMTVDNHVGSPYQDRIYVTYTNFGTDGTAYIYESYSNDYGQSFSPPHVVSATSSFCDQSYGFPTPQGNCNENQDSQPFTGPDGALYVVYNNYNNTVKGQDNRNQIFIAKSTDGGNTFSAPVKVSDYYDLPDCGTYQQGKDLGRACVPEKNGTANSYFRATNYPVGAVNPTNPQQVVVTFGSYINKDSNESNGCVPAGFNPVTGDNTYTGVKTPGACNNDILLSVSNDGGATFTGTTTDPRNETVVDQDPDQATTDQFWQWAAFNKNGKFGVSYYDRQYGSDEATGYSDVSLSGSGDLTNFNTNRVTSSSMPPPTQFQGLFFGDYSGMTAVNNAYPAWMDTRPPAVLLCPGSATPGNPPQQCTATTSAGIPLNDQDVFIASLPIPAK